MIRSFLAALFLGLGFLGYSQQYNFINYSIKEGLAQSQALTICQDKKGYLWVGTAGGVSRFDGTKFTNYSTDDGLLSNRIEAIFEDTKGNIWLGGLRGLTRWDGSNFDNYLFEGEFARSAIIAVAEDSTGNIWVGTNSSGAAKFNGSDFEYFNESNGLNSNIVRTIYTDPQGTLWFGTRWGISAYKDNRIYPSILPQFDNINVSKIIGDHSKKMWIGTTKDGLFSYANDSIKHYGVNEGLIESNIQWLCQDYLGNIWLCGGSEVNRFDGKTFTAFNPENGLPRTNLRSIMQDNEGNIWLSSDPGGIYKFTGVEFVNYTVADGICSDFVMAIAEDSERNIWFGTYDNSVCRYDGENFENFSPDDGITKVRVWSVMVDHNDDPWFGTSEGLIHLREGKLTDLSSFNGLANNRVTAIYEDDQELIWIGTNNGVSTYNGIGIRNYSYPDSFPGRKVRGIIQDKKQNYWFATANGAVYHDGKNFKLFTTEDGLPDNLIHNIVQDTRGNLWFGTGNGISVYDFSTFKNIRLAQNYSSNHVNFLVFDDNEQLWIGSNNGVFKLDSKVYYEQGKISLQQYTDLDGITSLETNLNAGFKDHEGNIWMGTSLGTVKYNPNKDPGIQRSIEPLVSLNEVDLFLSKTNWEEYADTLSQETGLPLNLELASNLNYLTFKYVGISHTNPEKVRYKFILEGFEDRWSPVTEATFATYSNLPSGQYTFKVLAQNKDRIWNTIPATFSFEILPPIYFTWWFICLCILTLCGIAWLIYRWRINVNAREKETEQLVNKSKMLALEQQTLNSSMNRHFIFNALNSIQYYINRQDRLSANKYLTSFAKLVRKNLDSSQTNVVALSEELDRLELYLSLEHMRFSNKFEYEIKIDEHVDTETIKIPAMLLQPYVENSIWHGILPMESNGKISVIVEQKQENLRFLIEDNGIGIETSLKRKNADGQDHISQGMAITNGRINLLREMTKESWQVKGPYEIKSDADEALGTRVEIILPINTSHLMN